MSANFNYIAFGNSDYVEGAVDVIEMDRGRMFEYTPIEIATRLEGLGSKSLAFLEKLPTFLCSEVDRSGDAPSMLIKYGRIENTKSDRRTVSTAFKTLMDFGKVSFTSVDHARDILEANGFQLYRTHWAVREGNVQEILARLAQLKPAVAISTEPSLASSQSDPPLRDKNTIGKADSVETFLKLLYGWPAKEATETFFRGHEDERFELRPSLLRKSQEGEWQYMLSEDRLCKELLIAHHDEFQADEFCFDRLVRMQHYGLPTRLLDISENPLIALFFACGGVPTMANIDGEVIIVRVSSDKVKYFDSDTVSCIANLSNLTYEQKNNVDLKLGVEAFNETSVVQKLLHHIKSEKGFFEARIVPDDLGSIICVKAKRTNTRIKSQSGAFLLFGHEAVLPESGQDGVEIARVTIVNKPDILAQLDRININVTTVYPSIDQTTVHLRERYRQSAPNK